jgi:hypothetical protein
LSEAGFYQRVPIPLERSGVPPEGGSADCLVGRGPVRFILCALLGSFEFVFYEGKWVSLWLFRGPLWLSPTNV